MKKLSAILLVILLVSALCACGKETGSKTTIGVCQLVQHEALDKATQGFIDAVTEGLGAENVEILNQNAGGESSSCTTIVNGFVSRNVDLIMANATASLQAASAATSEIPVLGTSITDYASALEIDNWNGVVGGNVSGASDLAPLEKQAEMITEWFPDTKKVAIIYCSSESNSLFQAEEIAKVLQGMNIESKTFTFTDSNDITAVTQNACSYADVIYIPTDNTAAANTEAIANVVIPAKVPVIAGEQSTCTGCGIATLSIDYYDLGVTTGKMAVKILKGEADVSTMPVEYASEFTKYYNKDICDQLGITPLDGYKPIN